MTEADASRAFDRFNERPPRRAPPPRDRSWASPSSPIVAAHGGEVALETAPAPARGSRSACPPPILPGDSQVDVSRRRVGPAMVTDDTPSTRAEEPRISRPIAVTTLAAAALAGGLGGALAGAGVRRLDEHGGEHRIRSRRGAPPSAGAASPTWPTSSASRRTTCAPHSATARRSPRWPRPTVSIPSRLSTSWSPTAPSASTPPWPRVASIRRPPTNARRPARPCGRPGERRARAPSTPPPRRAAAIRTAARPSASTPTSCEPRCATARPSPRSPRPTASTRRTSSMRSLPGPPSGSPRW